MQQIESEQTHHFTSYACTWGNNIEEPNGYIFQQMAIPVLLIQSQSYTIIELVASLLNAEVQ